MCWDFLQNSDSAPSPLKPGDTVLSINGIATPTWDQAFGRSSRPCQGPRSSWKWSDGGTRRNDRGAHKDKSDPSRVLGYLPIRPIIEQVGPGHSRRPRGFARRGSDYGGKRKPHRLLGAIPAADQGFEWPAHDAGPHAQRAAGPIGGDAGKRRSRNRRKRSIRLALVRTKRRRTSASRSARA